MSETEQKSQQTTTFNPENYTFETLDDEIRVDNLCKILLKQYHQYLLEIKGISPLKAGANASGADYFLRDFMIDNRRTNIITISPELIHSFAGNWYIINSLEPNMAELENILIGIDNFYSFCVEKKMLARATAETIHQAGSRIDYYRERITSFNEISGAGFIAWNNICPLK